MASFASNFPVAYHVLPLQAWKSISRDGALFAKPGRAAARPSTARVDEALGFDHFVHFYLASSEERLSELPILQVQMQPALAPPFPHVVLELRTEDLDDAECVICNWNLAVSRLCVPGVAKGGNWTRGTSPARIQEVWDAFRRLAPSPSRARGFFSPDRAVPTLEGGEIAEHVRLLGKAPRKMPELLLDSVVALSRFRRLLVFAESDADLLEGLGHADLPVELVRFPGYDGSTVPEALRQRMSAYFAGEAKVGEGTWGFDSIRPVKRPDSPHTQ